MNRNSNLLILGNFITRLGSSIYMVALSWWLVEGTGTALDIGFILGAGIVPAVIIGPFSGALVDTFDRRKIMIYTDLISSFFLLILGIMIYLDFYNLLIYMLISFLIGICTTLFMPASRAILPELTDSDKLVKVNSLFASSSAIASVLGPFLGGIFLLIPYIGVHGSIFINSLTFVLSAIVSSLINYKKSSIVNFRIQNIISDTKIGIIYALNTKFIRNLLLLAFLVNIFLTALSILLPLYISDVIKEESTFYSASLTLEAIGSVVIGIVLSVFTIKPAYRTLSMCMLLIGATFTIVYFIPFNYYILISMFTLGILGVAFDTLYFSYIQENIDEDKMGRVFSTVFMLATLSMGVSYFITGFFSIQIVEYMFLIVGLGTLVVTIPFLFIRNSKSVEKEKKILA